MNSLLRRKPKPLDLRELPDAEWRIAESLGEERNPVAMAALLKAMHGWDEHRADRARELITGMGAESAIPSLMDALREPRRYDQELVGRLLAHFAPDSVQPLLRALHDPRTMRRAAVVLADLKAPEAVPVLIEKGTTGKRKQRRTAIWALGRHGSVAGYDTVLTAFNSRDKEMRRTAAHALGCIGDPRAVEPLTTALGDRDDEMRQSAVFALEKLHDARGVPALIALMRKEAHLPAGISYSAAKAASACEPEGPAALMEAARDVNPKVRYYAFMGLERDRGKQPIRDEALIQLLGDGVADDDSSASHAAASALKPYNDRLAADVLLPHLDDPRPHVRASAISGIWAHSDDDVVAGLARLLREDPEAKIRRDAAWGLGVTRSRKAEAPLVQAIDTDADPEVVDTARKSLGWIRNEHRRG